jgi:hypothetical protein
LISTDLVLLVGRQIDLLAVRVWVSLSLEETEGALRFVSVPSAIDHALNSPGYANSFQFLHCTLRYLSVLFHVDFFLGKKRLPLYSKIKHLFLIGSNKCTFFIIFGLAEQISTAEVVAHQAMESQSSVEFRKDSTMDAGGPHEKAELSRWMSQL